MSYDIYFRKDGETCSLPFRPPIGGTYCADDGYREAHFNITYNYGGAFATHGLAMYAHDDEEPGTAVLDGMNAFQVVQTLAVVIPTLGDDVTTNYWDATEGNAKQSLINLLSIAVAVPQDAKCEVE